MLFLDQPNVPTAGWTPCTHRCLLALPMSLCWNWDSEPAQGNADTLAAANGKAVCPSLRNLRSASIQETVTGCNPLTQNRGKSQTHHSSCHHRECHQEHGSLPGLRPCLLWLGGSRKPQDSHEKPPRVEAGARTDSDRSGRCISPPTPGPQDQRHDCGFRERMLLGLRLTTALRQLSWASLPLLGEEREEAQALFPWDTS